jgi:hypothetical protein
MGFLLVAGAGYSAGTARYRPGELTEGLGGLRGSIGKVTGGDVRSSVQRTVACAHASVDQTWVLLYGILQEKEL